jgi:hypothetical protein
VEEQLTVGRVAEPGPLARGQRPHVVALVRSGAKFENGFLVERDETVAA